MESSRYFIWVKRLAPIVVILALWYGYDSYDQYQLRQDLAEDTQIAEATAYLYLGAFKHRADSLGYIEYRDSLLGSFDLTEADLHMYAEGEGMRTARYRRYVKIMGAMVDSLYKVEDSLRQERELVGDSLEGKGE